MKITILLAGAIFLAGYRYPACEMVAGVIDRQPKQLYLNGYRRPKP